MLRFLHGEIPLFIRDDHQFFLTNYFQYNKLQKITSSIIVAGKDYIKHYSQLKA